MNRKLLIESLGAIFMLLGGAHAAFAAPISADCSLLTPGQLEKVLAQPFGPPSKTTAPPAYLGQSAGAHCEYTSQKASSTKVIFIVYVDKSASDAKATFAKLAMWFPARSKPSGIGDSAYIDKSNAIHVLKGAVRFYVSIESSGDFTPAKEKLLKDVAASVASGI